MSKDTKKIILENIEQYQAKEKVSFSNYISVFPIIYQTYFGNRTNSNWMVGTHFSKDTIYL